MAHLRFNLTPWLYYRDPSDKQPTRMMAGEGATRQEGSKPAFTCDCGSVLVWVKSTRTGKSYLATCFPRHQEGWYYVKSQPHTQEAHAENLARREAFKVWDAPNAAAYEEAIKAHEQMKGEQS
jgi:hypothetical protein